MGAIVGNVLVCFQVASQHISQVKAKMFELGYRDTVIGMEQVKLPETALVKGNTSTDLAMNDLQNACFSSHIRLENAIVVLTRDGRAGGSADDVGSQETLSIKSEGVHDGQPVNPTPKRSRRYSSSGNANWAYYDEADIWSCDVCGGSDETGCLYHDPTECRRSDNEILFD